MTDATNVERAWQKLRRRKVVQWGIAYAAGSWGFLQGLEYVSEAFNWPSQLRQVAILAILIGLPIVLVVAWYHGDRGAQRVSGAEITIITLLFLSGGGLFWWYGRVSEAPAEVSDLKQRARSIAVLPFVNLSGDPGDEYFSDGLSEELLNSLARINGLKVAARTASFQFKNRTGDVADIARQLKVAHVLEGGVRRVGDRVRITAQLVNAADGYPLWSDSYDREFRDILSVQAEIANQIAGALQLKLADSSRRTNNPDAFDLLLRARHEMRQRNASALVKARGLAERATRLDPDYAEAWSTLASILTVMPDYVDIKPEDLAKPTEHAARRAIALDPALGEPHAVLAALSEQRLDLLEADRHYQHALELQPGSASTRLWYAQYLSRSGYTVEARRELQRAQELEPTNAAIHIWLALEHLLQADSESADAALAESEKLGSRRYAQFYRGWILMNRDDAASAVEHWNRYWTASGVTTRAPQLLVDALANPDHRPAAVAALKALPPEEFGYYAFLMLGDVDGAIAVLKASSRGVLIIDNVIWWPQQAALRRSVAFRDLVRHLRFDELWRARGWPVWCRPRGTTDFECH